MGKWLNHTDTDTDYADYQDYGSDYPGDGDTEFQQIGDQAGYDSWWDGGNIATICDKCYNTSPSLWETPKSGATGLWYTGCYINEEDACLQVHKVK